jgi:hypothetical protein
MDSTGMAYIVIGNANDRPSRRHGDQRLVLSPRSGERGLRQDAVYDVVAGMTSDRLSRQAGV